MQRRYALLDVFADTPLAGNPLAVVRDSAGLEDGRMQAMAREFNLSETVFVLPPENPAHTARIRIFTPGAELPFAGHPTVGAALLLAGERLAGGTGPVESVLILEEAVGPVRCGVFLKNAGSPRAGHVVFDVPKVAEAIPAALDREALAAALGLRSAEIGFENHHPTVFSAGTPYVFVPVRDMQTIAKAAAAHGHWSAALGGVSHAMYLYCRETVGVGRQFHARCFAPGVGIIEDAATGGAAAAFPGVIHRFDAHPSGNHRFIIEQGFEMGRPSLITLEVDIETDGVAAARGGGDAVIVAEGTLTID
jgi:trans-2,3-dihydro-3-hydroxyanthranilate isomerase